MSKGKKNVYTCQRCGEKIVTIDLDDGVTPFMLTCRVTPDCDGSMQSSFYSSGCQFFTPSHEWYKPTDPPEDPWERDHWERGGLFIREIPKESPDGK